MDEGTAIKFGEIKMREQAIENYLMVYRHLRVDRLETLEINAGNDIYILTYPYYNVRVESKAGIYDTKDEGLNEMQHIHRGIITIQNQSTIILDVKFIQIIPKH